RSCCLGHSPFGVSHTIDRHGRSSGRTHGCQSFGPRRLYGGHPLTAPQSRAAKRTGGPRTDWDVYARTADSNDSLRRRRHRPPSRTGAFEPAFLGRSGVVPVGESQMEVDSEILESRSAGSRSAGSRGRVKNPGSRLPGFYELPLNDRIRIVSELTKLNPKE